MLSLSPLEEFSSIYSINKLSNTSVDPLDHRYWKDRIIDDTKNKILYIVPSGYTQRTETGESRSTYYKAAWDQTVHLETERQLFPLGEKSHEIILKSEPQNQFDRYCIRVGITFTDSSITPTGFKLNEWQDIGFIPRDISKLITKNIDMLTKGKLINLYCEYQKNIFFGRVAFNYGKINKEKLVKPNVQRFHRILEE